MSYADWFFSPTDNINLLIEVLFGVLITAWVAGWWSRRKLEAWLNSPASDLYVDRIVARIPKYPKVPSLAEIAAEVQARMPVVPTVAEIVAALPEPTLPDMTPLATQIVEVMTERTGQMLRAYSASQQNELNAWIRQQAGPGGHVNLAQDSALETVLTSFTDAKTAKKVSGLYRLMKQHGQGKGMFGPSNGGGQQQAPPQPQWQMGQIVTTSQGTFQLTPQGWVPLQQMNAAQYPGFGPAAAFPGGPSIPTPGANAPADYKPDPLGPVPDAPPKASEVKPREPAPPAEVPAGAQ